MRSWPSRVIAVAVAAAAAIAWLIACGTTHNGSTPAALDASVHLPAGNAGANQNGTGDAQSRGDCATANPGEGQTGAPAVLETQVSNDQNLVSGEPWVATNPLNPQIVIAAWTTVGGAQAAKNSCGVARSTDGGKTWTQLAAQVWGPQPGPVGDATVGVGPDGAFYVLCSYDIALSQYLMITSTDNGTTWSAPVSVGQPGDASSLKYWDRPNLIVDPVTGDVYVSGSDDSALGRGVSASTDHGHTWGGFQPLDPDGQSAWGDGVAAAFGVLAAGYVVNPSSTSYGKAQPPAVACAQPCVVFETSVDHGATWSRRVMPASGVVVGGGFGAGVRISVAADPMVRGRYALLVPTGSASTLEIWVTDDSGLHWMRTKVISAPTGSTLVKWAIAYSPTGASAWCGEPCTAATVRMTCPRSSPRTEGLRSVRSFRSPRSRLHTLEWETTALATCIWTRTLS